jgi:hypothetical protein
MLFEEVTIITFVHCIEDCNWFFRPTSRKYSFSIHLKRLEIGICVPWRNRNF